MDILAPIFKRLAVVERMTGSRLYVVGGFVRDIFLGKTSSKDLDIVVVGDALAAAKAYDLEAAQEGSLVEFPDFGTARYVILFEGGGQFELEFATARSEAYHTESRKPEVVPATLEQDLSRRDFTVNAMAAPISWFVEHSVINAEELRGAVIDPFNGLSDLNEKILRTPLDPDTTFSDDPLRMMRAVRFAAQLGFALPLYIQEAIFRNRERIKIVSLERVQEELLKLMATPEPSIGLQFMFDTQLLEVVLPEIAALDGVEDVYGHTHKNNLTHTFKVVDNVALRSDDVWLRLAGLFHDIGKPATKEFVPKIGWTFHAHEHVGRKMMNSLGRRLRLPNDKIQYLSKLIRWHLQPIALMDDGITDSAVRRLIVTLGDDINDLLILGRSDITTGNPYKKERRLKNYDVLETRVAEVIEKDKLRAFQSPVRGEEIMAVCGLKPGPTVGTIKKALEEAILEGEIPNEYEAARTLFEKIKDQYLAKAADWEKTGITAKP